MEEQGSIRRKPDSEIVIKLLWRVYGLKQAGHNWYYTLNSHFVKRMKMKHSQHEAGMYISKTGGTSIALVDDLLLIRMKGEVVEMQHQIRL